METRRGMLFGSRASSANLPWLWLSAILFAGLFARTFAAVVFPRIERPDEIFQNLEPAYRLLTGYGVVTWEWRDGIRSWLFPGFLSAIMSVPSLLHLPAEFALPLIWLALAVVSCGVIAAGVILGWRQFGWRGAILCGVLTAFWPDLVYFGPKTLGEVQSGNLLIIAAAIASRGPAAQTRWRPFVIGILLGFAFDLRFQLALSLLLVAVWACRLELRRAWLPLALGVAGPLLLLGVTDWWTLGSPYQSIWKNIQVNLIEHKASIYSIDPVYTYLYEIVARNGAISVLAFALFIYGFRSAPLLALTSISVIGFHSVVAHKEISFIYAALPCAMINIGLGASRFLDGLQQWLKRPPEPRFALASSVAFTLATIGAILISARPFRPPSNQVAMDRLFKLARVQRSMCGLGLVGEGFFPWFDTGGYTYLRRDVPIYLTLSAQDLADSRNGFDFAIAERLMAHAMPGFSMIDCTLGYCLFHQEGGCQRTALHTISTELSRINR